MTEPKKSTVTVSIDVRARNEAGNVVSIPSAKHADMLLLAGADYAAAAVAHTLEQAQLVSAGLVKHAMNAWVDRFRWQVLQALETRREKSPAVKTALDDLKRFEHVVGEATTVERNTAGQLVRSVKMPVTAADLLDSPK